MRFPALFYLQLQNLQYEKAHLLREIAYCKDFPMPELDKIDLIDKASFLEAAPETGAAVMRVYCQSGCAAAA